MTESHLQRFLTAGQPTVPHLADCDLHAVVTSVAALVAPSCGHRGVELQLPDSDQSAVHAWADVEQLRQRSG
jgi:hypothetical protein